MGPWVMHAGGPGIVGRAAPEFQSWLHRGLTMGLGVNLPPLEVVPPLCFLGV